MTTNDKRGFLPSLLINQLHDMTLHEIHVIDFFFFYINNKLLNGLVTLPEIYVCNVCVVITYIFLGEGAWEGVINLYRCDSEFV